MKKRINIADSFAETMIPGLSWGLNKEAVISILGQPDGEVDAMLIYDIVELYFETEGGKNSLCQINIGLYKHNNKNEDIFQYGWLVDGLSLGKLSKKANDLKFTCKFELNSKGFILRMGDHCYALTDELSLPSGELMIYKITYHQQPFQSICSELYSVASFLTEQEYDKLISSCAKYGLSINGMIKKFINESE